MLPIQVLIVEDDPMARTLFEIYLKNSEKYKVAGSVESAAMAELYCLTKQIDLILMDVCTALHASGLDAAEKIKKNHPGIKILIVTSQPECDFIERARRAGVDSFWYKEPSEENHVCDQQNHGRGTGLSVFSSEAEDWQLFQYRIYKTGIEHFAGTDGRRHR